MSTYAIPNRQVNTKRKTHKKKYRLTKDGKFVVMVVITFAILFLFSMFIYALSANSVNVDAGQSPIYSSGGTSNNGTFNDVPEILVSDSKEETETTTDEIIEETTEEITDDTTPRMTRHSRKILLHIQMMTFIISPQRCVERLEENPKKSNYLSQM